MQPLSRYMTLAAARRKVSPGSSPSGTPARAPPHERRFPNRTADRSHCTAACGLPSCCGGSLVARSPARARCSRAPSRTAQCGSPCSGRTQNNFFTSGGVELFDLAAQGRIDAFFLGGGQIDGQANINLVGTGEYPNNEVRWPGCFGSSYLYFLVPRVILFREEHSRRVMVPKVDFISAPGVSEPGVRRLGGPYAMLTELGLFSFDRDASPLQARQRAPRTKRGGNPRQYRLRIRLSEPRAIHITTRSGNSWRRSATASASKSRKRTRASRRDSA